MPEIRRGGAAIAKAAESRGTGDFKPFCPSVRWGANGEEKYVLILTPIDQTPTLNVHEFIQIGTRDNGKAIFGFYASRKDPGIGESHDQIEDEFGKKPAERTFGVAVELEPEFDASSGRRPRVKSFKVATDTYDRKNEDGTTEEVTFPLVGVVSQASVNFYNHLRSQDEDNGPLEELPLKIKRIGTGKDTQYSFTPYIDVEVDMTGLIEHIGGVGYVTKDVKDSVKNLNKDAAAILIANDILDSRVVELTDKEAYDEGVNPLEVIKGYKENYTRGGETNGNAPVSQEPHHSDDEQDPSEDGDKAEGFARIRERAAKKK